MDERGPPLLADDLRAENDVAELARHAVGSSLAGVDREGEDVGRLVDPRCSRFSRRISSGAANAIPRSPSSIPSAASARRQSSTAAAVVDGDAAPVLDLDPDHRRRCAPVSSAWRLYASTMRWTSTWRTTSWFPNSTNSIPSIVAEDLAHADQARGLVARKVDLGHVAGDDDLRAEPEPGQEHLHLLGRRVLGLVEDDERVVERAPAHERERRHLDRPLLEVRVEPVGVEHVVERVEERSQVRVDLREHVAREEAEPLPGLDGGPRQDDPAHLRARPSPRPRAPSRGRSCRCPPARSRR